MSKLAGALIEFRNSQSRLEGMEDYRVLQYKTIEEIARTWPKTLEALAQIKGIGPAKLKKYGNRILEIVRGCVDNTDAVSVVQMNVGVQNRGDNVSSSGPAIQRGGLNSVIIDVASESEMANDSMTEAMKQTVTVGEYLDYLNLVFQKTADVKVVGEIMAIKPYSHGYYFDLKDKVGDGILNCFIPQYTYSGIGLSLEDGMEVGVEGVPRLTKRSGRFQFTVENLELVGEGALKKAYDLLKAKLEADGLFARRRELPEFISSVGIITSKSGAVIHDFRSNLAPLGIKLYLRDVRVEGASSTGMITSAIKWFNKEESVGVDVLVIMRGGGSLEDLRAFNNEAVARAIFASNIPTIVAIGHDKDVPLAQLVADIATSTPTAAALAVSSTWNRLIESLPQAEDRLMYNYSEALRAAESIIKFQTQKLIGWWGKLQERGLAFVKFLQFQIGRHLSFISQQILLLDGHKQNLISKQALTFDGLSNRLATAQFFLGQASPERQLKLGYSIVRNERGAIIRSAGEVHAGDELRTQFTDGNVKSRVI